MATINLHPKGAFLYKKNRIKNLSQQNEISDYRQILHVFHLAVHCAFVQVFQWFCLSTLDQ